jgi:hypothetical protein
MVNCHCRACQRAGSLDDPISFQPAADVWIDSRQPWDRLDRDTRKFARGPILASNARRAAAADADRHRVELLIAETDAALNREDFDTLLDIYSDDAILVVRPGLNASGKVEIRHAFEAIAARFDHKLHVSQAGMRILESGNTDTLS